MPKIAMARRDNFYGICHSVRHQRYAWRRAREAISRASSRAAPLAKAADAGRSPEEAKF